MLPRVGHLAVLRAIIHWLRRAGPIGSLLVALTSVQILFFGCIEFSEGRFQLRRPESPAPVAVQPDRQIRVRLLGRSPKPSADLSVTASFSVNNSASGAPILSECEPLENAIVRPSGSQAIQLGPKTIPCADILIVPARDAAIVLGGQTYRGQLRIQRSSAGLAFINLVDMESYVRGVLRGELPGSFHPESFKAQAVAARTYALYQKGGNAADRFYDVFDDEGSQMYVGVRGEDRIASQAVEQTEGEVCAWFDGNDARMFCTYYSSTCGGLSQHVRNVKPNDPDIPPLGGNVPCTDCANAKYYRWGPAKVSKADVTKKILARYPNLKKLGTITDLNPKGLTPDGRIIRIELVGSGGAKETLLGEDFRLAIGSRVLRSTNFKIAQQKDQFIFKDGKGFGHGLGLCQYGMEAKARRGMDYKQILSTYYPGAIIKKLY